MPPSTAPLKLPRKSHLGGPVARAAKTPLTVFDMPMEEALIHERACYDRTLGTEDRLEALAAFAEKRPPVFQGR